MLIAVLTMLFAPACAQEGGRGTGPAVRDSAGIRIVENGPVEYDAAQWRLSEEPVFRFGWGAADPQFAGVTNGVILSDGHVVVTTYDPRRVFVISPTGELLREFSREGPGPGDLGAVAAVLGLGRDTVLVQHDRIRFSVFHAGELVRETPIAGAGRSVAAGMTTGGRLLLLPNSGSGIQRHDTAWARAPIVGITLDGEQWDTIGTFDYLPPTANRPTFAPYGSAAVSGGSVVVSRGDLTELTWLDEPGPRQIARWDVPRPAVTDSVRSEVEAYLREYYRYPEFESVPAAEIDRRIAASLDLAHGMLPFHGYVLGDADGNAWLPRYLASPGWPDRYSVVAADGRWLGVVHCPGDTRFSTSGQTES